MTPQWQPLLAVPQNGGKQNLYGREIAENRDAVRLRNDGRWHFSGGGPLTRGHGRHICALLALAKGEC
jgi:hypothetical protein